MLPENKGPVFVIGGGILIFAIALFVVLTSLSGAVVEDSLKEIKLSEKAKTDTKTKEDKYIQELKSYKGDTKVALDKAKFEAGFEKSKSLVKASEGVVVKMNAIIQRDDSKEEDELKRLLASLKRNNVEIMKNNTSIVSKKNELVDLIKNISTKRAAVQNKLLLSKALTDATVGELNKAKKDHPGKTADIDAKLKKTSATLDRNARFSQTLKAQIDNKEYANAYKTIKEIDAFVAAVDKENTGYRNLMKQLYKSYAKILSDMKVDYYASLGRSSWDSWSDYDDTKNYVFSPVKISERDLDILATASGVIASGKPRSPSARHAAWSVFRGKVNPGQSIGSGHDDSEFWVEDVDEKYYHRYIVVENTKKTETGWVEVSEAEFMKHQANLGMEIVSKPYGMYESEKSLVATPPGMRTVGNSRYGEWRNDSSGNSFWHYYGMYSFWGDILGGNRYSRYDYDHYNTYRRTNRSSPYYGNKKQYGTFGSSTQGSKRYSRSTYMQKNRSAIKSGKLSSRTVRGAGSKSRGRGAAGGGK